MNDLVKIYLIYCAVAGVSAIFLGLAAGYFLI